MRYVKTLLLFVLIIGCNQKNKLLEREAGGETEFRTNDTIPENRKIVKDTPIASYLVPSKDIDIKYKFGVKVFETPFTFRYLLEMHYDGMKVKDTLKIPNFGTWPVIEVRPTEEKLACIIGFLDKEKNFKEYKLLTAKDDKLRLKVLRHYFVGSYRTEY